MIHLLFLPSRVNYVGIWISFRESVSSDHFIFSYCTKEGKNSLTSHTMPPLLVQDISLFLAIMLERICLATSTCESNPSKPKNKGIMNMKSHCDTIFQVVTRATCIEKSMLSIKSGFENFTSWC